MDITFVFYGLTINDLEKLGCRRTVKKIGNIENDAIEIGNSVFLVHEYEDKLYVFIPLSEINNKDHVKTLENILNDILQLTKKVIMGD